MEELESDGLLPRFSLRWFSLYFTLSIFFAWVIRQAVIGQLWALAAVFTVALMVVFFVIYAGLFFVIWLPTSVARIDSSRRGRVDEPSPTNTQSDLQ